MSGRRKVLLEATLFSEYIGDMYAYKYRIVLHTTDGKTRIFSGKNAEFEAWRAYKNMIEALKTVARV